MGSVHALLIIALLWGIFIFMTRKSEPASRAEELDMSLVALFGDPKKEIRAPGHRDPFEDKQREARGVGLF